MNCQSSSFPLSASPVTFPSKPIIGNFRLLFVSNSIIMFFGEVEIGVCETMNRTATMVFWVGGPRSYPEAGHFLWNLETDFVWIWEFLCSAATIGIKLNLISISLYKIWNWFVDVACLAESKSPEMQRETRGRGRGKEGKGETFNEILVLICPFHRFLKSFWIIWGCSITQI